MAYLFQENTTKLPQKFSARCRSRVYSVFTLRYEYIMRSGEKEQPLQKKELAEMQKTQNLQDLILNQARRDRSMVTVFLMNGF